MTTERMNQEKACFGMAKAEWDQTFRQHLEDQALFALDRRSPEGFVDFELASILSDCQTLMEIHPQSADAENEVRMSLNRVKSVLFSKERWVSWAEACMRRERDRIEQKRRAG